MQAINRNQDDASIANRYLAGQLSPAEEEAYEQYFVRNPDAVQELEATARMKVGLANLRETGQLDALLSAPAAPAFDRRKAMLALVASLAFVVIGVGIWRGLSVPDGAALMATAADLIDRSSRPLAVGETYVLLRTRASDYDAIVELPVQPRAIELRVLPEAQSPVYGGALSRILPDGSVEQIARVKGLKAQSDGFVRIYVDSSKLEAGPHLLVLSAAIEGANESVTSSFRLRVLSAGRDAPSNQ